MDTKKPDDFVNFVKEQEAKLEPEVKNYLRFQYVFYSAGIIIIAALAVYLTNPR